MKKIERRLGDLNLRIYMIGSKKIKEGLPSIEKNQ
jgi:hypothetical protein